MNSIGMLQALYARYESLRERGEIPDVGFRSTDVHYVLVLDIDGNLKEVQERGEGGKSKVGQWTAAPYRGKRTSGVKANFLCDTSKYLLGCEWGSKQKDGIKLYPKHLEDALSLHFQLKAEIDHPHYDAVCKFLKNCDPEAIAFHIQKFWKRINSKRLAFQIIGHVGFVHELAEVRAAWAETMPRLGEEKGVRSGLCSITGQYAAIADVHPPVLGIIDPGGMAEKALVSFNCDAFTSYGLEQSQNAPASLTGAWGYTATLNDLLAKRRIRIGDMSVVYWAGEDNQIDEIFGYLVEGVRPDEDESTKNKVMITLKAISKGGGKLNILGITNDTPFYVAGLAPSSGRIVVRFWLNSSLKRLLGNLGRHYQCLEIIRSFDEDPEYPTAWNLLRAVLPYRENYQPSYDDLPPLLGGALMRAILEGAPYPDALAHAVVRRIRADRVINYCRAAILKAWLIRKPNRQGVIPVSLDTERTDPAYRLGRLFAVLEGAQYRALGDVGASIRDRFYSSASATPAMVFPRLLRNYQHHLGKMGTGAKINFEKSAQEIIDGIDAMPAHLNLESQALFAIGYYHQRKALFNGAKKTEPTDPGQE